MPKKEEEEEEEERVIHLYLSQTRWRRKLLDQGSAIF